MILTANYLKAMSVVKSITDIDQIEAAGNFLNLARRRDLEGKKGEQYIAVVKLYDHGYDNYLDKYDQLVEKLK